MAEMGEDKLVVANNVELVSMNIQDKVGSSLIGLKGAAQETVEGVSQGSLGVLEDIKTLQQKTVDKVHHVWEILKSSLDIEKDQARRLREQGADPEGGKPKVAGGETGGGGLEGAADEAGKGFGSGIMEKIGLVGAGMFSMAGITKIAGLIFKSALIFMLAGYLGDAIVDKFDIESEGAKTALTLALPAMAALIPLLGFKGFLLMAIPAIIGMGFASVISWLKGDKTMDQVSGFDWGAVALTGPALLALGKYAGLLGAKGLTLGGLAIGWPVLLAGSLAIALAAGVGYLFSKVAETERKTLDHLDEMTSLSQKEFERRLEEQKGSFLSNIAPGLAKTFGGETTQLQDAFMATKAAQKIVEKGGELTPEHTKNLVASVEMFTKMDDDTLKAVLDDKHKADELMRSIHNMYQIVQTGQLGEDSSKVIKQLAALSQNIQMTAEDMLNEEGRDTSWGMGEGYLKTIAGNKGYGDKGLDVFENYAKIIADPKYQKLKSQADEIKGSDRYKELSAIDRKDMTKDEQKEWRDMTWKLARTEGQMNMMDKSQMGGMAGDIQMIDMIKLLSAEDQAILLEQALSDKKVLLNAAKKLEAEDKHFAPVSNFTKVDGSPQIITKNTSSISATAVYEVDGALQRAMNQ